MCALSSPLHLFFSFFFLIFLLPYVIFTMRAHMIEVTTVGSRLRVSRDDDLELLLSPSRLDSLVGG